MEYEITENIKKATLELEETIKKLKEKLSAKTNEELFAKLEKAIMLLEELEEEC